MRDRHELLFRCVAFPGSNDGKQGFFAECIDANLMVWRSRQSEAVHAMEELIVGFVESVATTSSSHDEFHELIDQPSPWQSRVRYHYTAFRHAIPGTWKRLSYKASIHSIPTPEPEAVPA